MDTEWTMSLIEKLDQVELLLKHQPGKHDQRTHTPKKYLGSSGSGGASARMTIHDDEDSQATRAMSMVGVNKSDLAGMFRVDEIPDVEVEVYGHIEGERVEVGVVARFRGADGERLGESNSVLITDGTSKKVNLEHMTLAHTDAGVGSKLYMQQLETYKRTGFDKVELHAGYEIGRYAWARKGFDYTPPEGKVGKAAESWKRWKLDKMSMQFRSWCEWQLNRYEEPKGGWPRFNSAKEIADYDPGGPRVLGGQITNHAVSSDAKMHLGKAFMLDMGEAGHGEWDGELEL